MSERGNKTLIEYPGASPDKNEPLPIVDKDTKIDISKGLDPRGILISDELRKELDAAVAAREAREAKDAAALNEVRRNINGAKIGTGFQRDVDQGLGLANEAETAALESSLKSSPAKKAWTSIKKLFGA
jgi:hypothetical protein